MTKEYLAGHRIAYLPPLRAYLYAALVFFGLFTVFETKSPPVYVYTSGSVDAEQIRATSAGGSRVTFEFPQHVWGVDDRYLQEVTARAQANPDAFALAAYRNIPRAFFLFVPISALLLKLFYRKRYYVEHLMFALYHHAFVFVSFAGLFVLGRASELPDLLVRPMRWAIVLWLLAYFPLSLRRVFGGAWPVTGLKTIGLAVPYLVGFLFFGFGFVTLMAVLTF